MFTKEEIEENTEDFLTSKFLFLSKKAYANTIELKKEDLDDIQYEAGCNFSKGYSGLITGSAGNGKSYLLKKIIAHLRIDKRLKVAVTASTGLAAQNLMVGAQTIHSFVGAKLWHLSVDEFKKRVSKYPPLVTRWKVTQVLVIDEISMLSPYLFEKFELLARVIRKCELPFGGIQLICCGDWAQLPPIIDHYEKKRKVELMQFCFESKIFQKCMQKSYDLNICHRQENDLIFYNLLQEVRVGKVSPTSLKLLQSRINNSPIMPFEGMKCTKLYARKNDVAFENAKRLAEINEPIKKYNTEYYNSGLPSNTYEILVERLKKSVLAEEEIILKKGAFVMLVANIDVGRGFANGSQGIIEDFSKEENYPFVRFSNGELFKITPKEWKLTENPDDDPDTSPHACLIQIPLMLAYALTIHKSQSHTIEYVEIDLSTKIFEYGQAYTALSRCPKLEGINLIYFDKRSIRAHPTVLKLLNY